MDDAAVADVDGDVARPAVVEHQIARLDVLDRHRATGTGVLGARGARQGDADLTVRVAGEA